MGSYYITARKTSPITPVTVEADTPELAIIQVVQSAGEGEQIEVLQVQQLEPGLPEGATGTSRK